MKVSLQMVYSGGTKTVNLYQNDFYFWEKQQLSTYNPKLAFFRVIVMDKFNL